MSKPTDPSLSDPDSDARARARYTLRLPHTLKRKLEYLADREGVTLNSFLVYISAQAVGSKLESRPNTYQAPNLVDFVSADTPDEVQRTIRETTAVAHGLLADEQAPLAIMLFALLTERATPALGLERSAARLGKAARASLDNGYPQVAEAFWRKALALDPSNKTSCAAYGLYLFERQRYHEAIPYLAVADDRDSALRLLWARLFVSYQPYDREAKQTALTGIVERLKEECRDASDNHLRAHWLTQVGSLRRLKDPEVHSAVVELVEFANQNARWSKIMIEETRKLDGRG